MTLQDIISIATPARFTEQIASVQPIIESRLSISYDPVEETIDQLFAAIREMRTLRRQFEESEMRVDMALQTERARLEEVRLKTIRIAVEARYPRLEWRRAVSNNETDLGYAEWVEHQTDMEADKE